MDKKINLKKGIKRIYVVLSLLCLFYIIFGNRYATDLAIKVLIISYFLIPLYFTLKWIINGFKRD